MMTKICNFLKKNLLFFSLFFFFQILSAEETKWIIACEPFVNSGLDTSISLALSELIPNQILDNLEEGKVRRISFDEEFARTAFSSKNDRISLFLQLESAVRNRDALVLQYGTDLSLKTKLKAEEKKIQDIYSKIENNISQLNEAEKKAYEKSLSGGIEKKQLSEGEKYLKLVKGLVNSESSDLAEEPVILYSSGNGESHLYSSSMQSGNEIPVDYTDRSYVKKMQSAGIRALLTGKIKIIDDFLFVTAEVFSYPLGKSIITISEVGSLSDIDFISRSIARTLSPVISSSLPVNVRFEVSPEYAVDSLTFVIDDVVYNDISNVIVLDGGVHSIRFDSPGFRTASTSYYFEGNASYAVRVEMKEDFTREIKLRLPENVSGSFSLNGKPFGEIDPENNPAKIFVNDSEILGSFISEDDRQGFFYISEKLIENGFSVYVKPKLYDKSEYIDKRRKMMYTSYSVFLISFLGTIFSYGNEVALNQALQINPKNFDLYKKIDFWQKATLGGLGLSLCSGGWFAYELTRYFIAADSVLPANAK